MNEDERYQLTPWGCMTLVLNDYGIDYSHITPAIGVHMVEDFMDYMVKAGHIKKGKTNESMESK